jgi:hypothetical protein
MGQAGFSAIVSDTIGGTRLRVLKNRLADSFNNLPSCAYIMTWVDKKVALLHYRQFFIAI